ncbi:unnamed protein product, partial [Musa textilis]
MNAMVWVRGDPTLHPHTRARAQRSLSDANARWGPWPPRLPIRSPTPAGRASSAGASLTLPVPFTGRNAVIAANPRYGLSGVGWGWRRDAIRNRPRRRPPTTSFPPSAFWSIIPLIPFFIPSDGDGWMEKGYFKSGRASKAKRRESRRLILHDRN